MFIAGLAGTGFSWANAIGADKAQATNAEISIEGFIMVFLLKLNSFMFPLLAITGTQELP
jgi:hypothetical protein